MHFECEQGVGFHQRLPANDLTGSSNQAQIGLGCPDPDPHVVRRVHAADTDRQCGDEGDAPIVSEGGVHEGTFTVAELGKNRKFPPVGAAAPDEAMTVCVTCARASAAQTNWANIRAIRTQLARLARIVV